MTYFRKCFKTKFNTQKTMNI